MPKIIRKIVEIDEELCDGCGQCVPACAEGAIQIIDGKARLIDEKFCDGLGACLGDCPKGAIKIVEREADPFDEEAVKAFLASQKKEAPETKEEGTLPCGCPGSAMQVFTPSAPGPCSCEKPSSALSHWPIQIKLVPPEAPFLKGAPLLVAADCVGFSYPAFHQDLLPGKVLLVGCPKFDNAEEYVAKFSQIFASNLIPEITVAIMEVPCCRGLPMIIKKGLELAGKKQPFRVVVISPKGEIVAEENWN